MGLRYLFIGAHPDDPDFRAGGTALKLIRAGHTVKFVSLSNGECGHHAMSREALAARRYRETRQVLEVAGLAEYEVWQDVHDCELEPTIANRKRMIRMIRNFQPDVVVTHRICDYHADHRAAAQLVRDAAYLTQVPLYCDDTPIPEKNPVYAAFFDPFEEPHPFRPDAAVEVESVLEDKCRMLACQESQVFEWLAWEERALDRDFARMDWPGKQAFLVGFMETRRLTPAVPARALLKRKYGEERGNAIRFAESFEYSPYGRKVTPAEFQELFNV